MLIEPEIPQTVVVHGEVQVPAIITTTDHTRPSFFVHFDRITTVANKYMAILFNTSSAPLYINRVWAYSTQVSNVLGSRGSEQYLAKISTPGTGGTTINIYADDSTDALPAGISASTNPSIAPAETYIRERFLNPTEEFDGRVAVYSLAMLKQLIVPIYSRYPTSKGIVLRANEGLAVRNLGANAGTNSYFIEFNI